MRSRLICRGFVCILLALTTVCGSALGGSLDRFEGDATRMRPPCPGFEGWGQEPARGTVCAVL